MAASTGATPSTSPLNHGRMRERVGWTLLGGLIMVLLVRAHLGFFAYVAWVAGAAGVLSWLGATVALTGIQLRRVCRQHEIEHSEAVEVVLTVRNGKNLPVRGLLCSDTLDPNLVRQGTAGAAVNLGANERYDIVYRLVGQRRGLFRIGPAVAETTGPLGLVRRMLLGSEAAFLTVLPRTVLPAAGDDRWQLGRLPIHQIPRRHSLFEDPSRYAGVREYRDGDSFRRIHWSATARAGRLLVRQFEPAVLGGLLLAVDLEARAYVDAAAGGTPTEREDFAVTVAASLGERVLIAGQSVGLLCNGGDLAERHAGDWSGQLLRRQTVVTTVLAAGHDPMRAPGSGSLPGPTRPTAAPLELAAGKGAWQRTLLRSALARLTLADGLPLATLLHSELPHLSRALVVGVITPDLSLALAEAIASLVRSGIEVIVLLVGPGKAGHAALPASVPVHVLASERDLLLLLVGQL